MSDVILNPVFKQEELDKLKKQAISGLKAAKEMAIITSFDALASDTDTYDTANYNAESSNITATINGANSTLSNGTDDDILMHFEDFILGDGDNTVLFQDETTTHSINGGGGTNILTFGAGEHNLSSVIFTNFQKIIYQHLWQLWDILVYLI